jgi:protease IV
MAKLSDYLKNIFFLLLILQFAPILFEGLKKQYGRYFEYHTKIGYLSIKGLILNSSYYTHYLKKYFEDKNIKAVLLFIESPGGAAGSSESIAHEIDLLKKQHPKPIITLSENIVASGGYYIASTTDAIIVSPSTLVGSIGATIPGLFKLEDFIEHYKIHYDVIKSGEYKSVTDPFINITPEQKEFLQTVVDSSSDNFMNHVIKHRSKLSGNQALKVGLVDIIGSKSDAIKKIKEMAIIEGEIEWVKPEKKSSFWTLFSSSDDYMDNNNSLMARLINSICLTLEERYGFSYGLKT